MAPELAAYERCRWARAWAEKLGEAVARLDDAPELVPERGWLEAARERVAGAVAPFVDLEDRSLGLEALRPARAARERQLRADVVEAVEALEAALLEARGPGAPLAELLFADIKLPKLRRASGETFVSFAEDFRRRLGSSYVSRQLEDPVHATVEPRARSVERSLAAWQAMYEVPHLEPDEAEALALELSTLAGRLEMPVSQARLLAEAALLTAGEPLADLALLEGPRKRGKKRPPRSEGGASGSSAAPS